VEERQAVEEPVAVGDVGDRQHLRACLKKHEA
jgi:hypothetical protein